MSNELWGYLKSSQFFNLTEDQGDKRQVSRFISWRNCGAYAGSSRCRRIKITCTSLSNQLSSCYMHEALCETRCDNPLIQAVAEYNQDWVQLGVTEFRIIYFSLVPSIFNGEMLSVRWRYDQFSVHLRVIWAYDQLSVHLRGRWLWWRPNFAISLEKSSPLATLAYIVNCDP